MTPLPDLLPITPFTRPVRGGVALPGSKSITNRALVLAALSDGTITLHGALFSRDTQIMGDALRILGFNITTDEPARTLTITGRGGRIPAGRASLHVGNAGTAARFLTALLCLREAGRYDLDSDEAMRRRPIGSLLEALRSQGTTASGPSFPFTIQTTGLPGGIVELDASESSQLLSALLMIAPLARTPLTVRLHGGTVSRPFVDMTMRMMEQFGQPPVTVSDGSVFAVPNGTPYHLSVPEYAIEGDATAASYFGALAIITRGELEIAGLRLDAGALQGDAGFFRLLESRGMLHPSGRQVTAGSARRGFTADFNSISDTFLSLAAIAPLLEGPTRITGIAHTRRQETDRVTGVARELRKLGQQVVETEDSIEIHPRPLISGVEIDTYHDHRFAMSFAILGCHDLHGNGRPWLALRDPACCAKTYPDFFDVLAALHRASH
ncbi:MAG: 3-phosphoshikimate 1-carboxyvinyltransferase [Opitutaceae bacterium]|nr:3-phosphoshikimate 1-carboxyvinyltransferase [Opitutaceae bacterium]